MDLENKKLFNKMKLKDINGINIKYGEPVYFIENGLKIKGLIQFIQVESTQYGYCNIDVATYCNYYKVKPINLLEFISNNGITSKYREHYSYEKINTNFLQNLYGKIYRKYNVNFYENCYEVPQNYKKC